MNTPVGNPRFGAYSLFHSTIYGSHGPEHSKQHMQQAYNEHEKALKELAGDNVRVDVYAAGHGVVPFIDGFPNDSATIEIYEQGVDAFKAEEGAVKSTITLNRKTGPITGLFVKFAPALVRVVNNKSYRESADDFIKRVMAQVKEHTQGPAQKA